MKTSNLTMSNSPFVYYKKNFMKINIKDMINATRLLNCRNTNTLRNILKRQQYNYYLLNANHNYNHQQICNYSNDNNVDKTPSSSNEIKKTRKLPMLMDFPEIVWPSIFKSIKNWILINFIIRPYFDNEFTIQDFIAGTKQALQVVSNRLAEGDVKSLKKLVAPEVIEELKSAISNFSVSQRSELNIQKDDIYLTFPYQVGIMFDESTEIQKRWVEVTMVFHVMRGFKELQNKGQNLPLNIGTLPEYRDKVSICNYRFIKEFTQGNESDWTINVVSHFKPSDYISE